MSSHIAAAIVGGVLLLSGCAVAPHQPLKAELRDQIGTTEVVVRLPQREINAQIVVSNVAAATGGGLIAALIDAGVNSSRTKGAETTVAPLRDALLGYSFDENFRTALDSGLRTVPRLSARPARVMKDSDESSYAGHVAASSAGAVLLASADYSLSADFSTAEVGLRAWLMPRSSGLRSASGASPEIPTSLNVREALYRNTFVVRTRLQDADSDQTANRGHWMAEDAQPLRQALDASVSELVAVLVEDLSATAGIATLGPALTTRYSRQRAADGTILVTGSAVTSQTLHQATALHAPVAELPATAAIPSPPTPPLLLPTVPEPSAPPSVTVARIEDLAPPLPAIQAGTLPPMALDTPRLPAPSEVPVQPLVTTEPAPAAMPPSFPAVAPTPATPMAAKAAAQTPLAALTRPDAVSPPTLALMQSQPEPEPRYDWRTRATTILRLQPTPDSIPSSTLAVGTGLNIVGKTKNMTGEWFYMQAANDTGWVRSTEIEATP